MSIFGAGHSREGKSLSFQKIPQLIDVPNLIELQRSSYEKFLVEGIREAFFDISPIEDFTGNLILEFLDHSLGEPSHSIDECQDKDMTFARPLKVKVRLITKEEGEVKEVKEQEIFMGDFPSMTSKGTFVINGAERVIVSQLVRSPGIYFQKTVDPTQKLLYVGMVIPNRGAWLEFESDLSDIISVRIDKTRKLPVTVLIRSLGYETDNDILNLFDGDSAIVETLNKDSIKTREEALIEIYRKLRPGDPPSAESANSLLKNLFFDPKRYNMAKVGRYKLNKKMGIKLACSKCGTLHKPGTVECPECSSPITYEEILSKEDIVAAVRYMAALIRGEKQLKALNERYLDVTVNDDDIDHLGNRRVRSVGELLQNQFRVGLLRLERVVRERMTVQDIETVTPQALINIRPVVAAIKEFFGSSQLSQFMDQTNSLAELTHKRRLSALGPGGLSRERAGFEVRDVHYSHYGRICPIETPEGPNIGLIGSLACYAKVNDFGFIMTPYRKVQNGVVMDDVDMLSADEEDEYMIAQANTPVDSKGNIAAERVVARLKSETQIVTKDLIEYIDVSPKQVVSVATALIPFLEHDDANRALMGANMQRQGVPLLESEAPLVGTGMESRAAKDSGALIVADEEGMVLSVDSNEIVIQNERSKKKTYRLMKFKRSNAGTCINQRPVVKKGDKIMADQVLADGASSVRGDLALGRNVLVAFMPWEGYNYEDAILLSEDLVKNDVFTSLHIEEYECEARDTKLGAEEVTRDIPNVGEEALKDLDERGIVRIGADVRPEDILVGKVTPKGETELTAEERLLRAIFGEKARDVRDTSMKVPHGEKGKVIDVKVFSRESNDELSPGVNQLVRVYVAQKRKILQGDKMAGRHGNKGVIAKILPIEDMPFLPDGTPVQIVLNPLGVPSRMNIGQILETHIGGASKALGVRVQCPVFDSAKEYEIRNLMKRAHLKDMLGTMGLELSPDLVGELEEEEDPKIKLERLLSSKSIRLTAKEIDKYIGSEEPVDEVIKFARKKKIDLTRGEVERALSSGTLKEKLHRILDRESIRISPEKTEQVAEYIDKFRFLPEDGKTVLIDGRTGETFDRRITIGQIYMMKLAHLVDDKIHARSTGPYSLITQQPLGGKAQFGGQRFGEMEVWALEAYGAAYTLQELLTVKSDDVVGRVKTYEAIVKGENVMEPGVPESFKVLIKELQSLCLDVRILSADELGHFKEIELKGTEDQDIRTTARDLGLDIEDETLSSI